MFFEVGHDIKHLYKVVDAVHNETTSSNRWKKNHIFSIKFDEAELYSKAIDIKEMYNFVVEGIFI